MAEETIYLTEQSVKELLESKTIYEDEGRVNLLLRVHSKQGAYRCGCRYVGAVFSLCKRHEKKVRKMVLDDNE